MKFYFETAIKDAHKHALKVWPEESCGVIIDGAYHPCNNVAADKTNTFKISPQKWVRLEEIGKIECIMHSHDDFPHASKRDMVTQQNMGIPFGLICLKHKSVIGTYFWGDTLPIQDLVGRPFVHGIYDCYSTARDYYRLKGLSMGDYPREVNWWLTEEDVILDNIKNENFEFLEDNDVKQLKEGDGLLCSIRTNKINHTAIYVGKGLILHHLYNRLSTREPLVNYQKYIRYIVRYKE